MKKEKIFHIGFHKTATSSFEKVYEILGYKLFNRLNNQHKLKKYYKTKNIEDLSNIIEKHDAFSDNPWFWNDLYLDLDKLDYDAKFILTTRDSEKWFKSLNKKHINMNIDARNHLYKGNRPTLENKDLFISKYESYNVEVLKYFQNKSNFIHIDIENGLSWDSICGFLGKKIPQTSFPWLNKS